MNGSPLQLPWQKVDSMDGASLISVRREDHWIVLRTYDGLRVRCSDRHALCEIVLPGRMHGRSSGLLGINDNEPSNDRDLVDGTQNDKVRTHHSRTLNACFQNAPNSKISFTSTGA